MQPVQSVYTRDATRVDPMEPISARNATFVDQDQKPTLDEKMTALEKMLKQFEKIARSPVHHGDVKASNITMFRGSKLRVDVDLGFHQDS